MGGIKAAENKTEFAKQKAENKTETRKEDYINSNSMFNLYQTLKGARFLTYVLLFQKYPSLSSVTAYIYIYIYGEYIQ